MIIFIFLISFVVAFYATPILINLAKRFNFLDHPNYRKLQKRDVPLLGGVAIYLGFLLTLLFFTEFSFWYFLIFFSGATIILIVGLIDDYVSLGAALKFMLPIFPLLFWISFGLQVNFLPTFWSFWFTIFWVMLLANAFNFIDNMNGLATGTLLINALFLGIAVYLDSHLGIALLSFALAGGALGFLPYNFPKAKIFLGDAGSMLAGFLLASLAIFSYWDYNQIMPSFYIPLLILFYPLFDLTFVSLRRIKNGQPPWIGDKNHTSHCLATILDSQTKTVLILQAISIISGFVALWARHFNFSQMAILLAILIVLALIFGLYLTSRVPFIRREKEENKI